MNLYGTASRDFINGTAASDMLVGLEGDDYLFGGGGQDLLIGGVGGDYLFGGSLFVGASSEFDMAAYWDSWTGVYVDLASGLGFGGTAEGDHLFDIEGLYGSLYGDQLVGNDADNVFDGLGGNDWLSGRGGRNELYGGAGDDMFEGGSGRDFFNGGNDIDTVYYSWAAAGVWANLGTGHGYAGDAADDTYLWVENLIGTRYGDTLEGSDAGNWLVGYDGNDALTGFDGADTLDGGMGHDWLDGGAGADTFVWTSIAETSGLDGPDEIEGVFEAVDRIDLRLIDADETAPGAQAFVFIGIADFTAPGQIRLGPAGGGGTAVLMNTDADFDADAGILVHGAVLGPSSTLGAWSFLL